MLIIRRLESILESLGEVGPVSKSRSSSILNLINKPMEGSILQSCGSIVYHRSFIFNALCIKNIFHLSAPNNHIFIRFTPIGRNFDRDFWSRIRRRRGRRGSSFSFFLYFRKGFHSFLEGIHKLLKLLRIHFGRVSLRENNSKKKKEKVK